MKTATSKTQKLMRVRFGSWRNGLAGVILSSCLLGGTTVFAMPTVTSLTDSSHGISGYRDGNTFSTALFHTPFGIALDDVDGLLYVADRDNNAIRWLDLAAGLTHTLTTNSISKPVGVAVDNSSGNVFVLNRGNGNNGTVLEFNSPLIGGDFISTNATALTNAAGIALDSIGNIYVTVRSNTLIRIAPNGSKTIVATITNAGTSLQGIVVKHNGLIAACDSGRNGIYLIDPSTGLVTTNAGFHGAGDFTTNGNNVASSATAKFNQPYGVAEAGDGSLIVTDYGNNRVKIVTTNGLVTNLYGVSSVYWSGLFPGWKDGTVQVPDSLTPNVQARLPVGIAFARDGTVYTTEDFYHLIRKVTGSGLPQPPQPPPAAPTTLTVTTNFGQVTLTWPAVVGATSYNVKRSTSSGGETTIASTTATSYTDSSVINGTTYYYVVSAVNTGGESANSSEVSATPPIPPPSAPRIGWFDYEGNNLLTVLHPVSIVIFNNDVLIAVDPTIIGISTYYTIDSSVPSSTNGFTPPPYQDGLAFAQPLPVTTVPDLVIKAVNVDAIGQSSPITTAEFLFKVANPTIVGNNGAQFTVSDITSNAVFWYTIDGTDPTNAPPSSGPIAITNGNPVTLSLNVNSNILFQARAFRSGYQPSGIAVQSFSSSNFVANTISFGFAAGEASSDFIASPGQTFYAPVTLNVLSSTLMYSLQFNMTVTNAGPNPGPAVAPGAFNFQSILMKPLPPDTNAPGVTLYTPIPPYMFIANAVNPPPPGQIVTYNGGSFVDLETINTNINLLTVGWLERAGAGKTNLFDTKSQDLIEFSLPHDTLFLQSGGQVVVGGYNFQVPTTAAPGQTYQIQIGRPSATSDGVGAPGSLVYIATPTNGSLAGGAINSIKVVTLGQRKYIAGDAYPFRWFNAGDFGNNVLENADVEQVFQSAIYNLNPPLPNSDFADSMDSCGAFGVTNSGTGYFTKTGNLSIAQQNVLFDGNDTTINQIPFGDGTLDVCDVYVTFRRSLDPNLTWYQRYWTNGVRVAEIVPNVVPHALVKSSATVQSKANNSPASTNSPQVNFSASNFLASAGQTIQVPITAQIFGAYPLRVLMLNLTVMPLDGSPALTTAVSFTPNSALGTPTFTDSNGNNNYAATWLDSTISGLTGNITIGTLTVTIPAGASANAAYAVHFDHASASPNGLASFPKQTLTGLITLSSRTNSSYGDGIPDSWRLRWFGTVNNYLSLSNACSSGDGINNWKKFVAGVDPNVANNFPSVNPRTPVPSGSTTAIHWPTVSGKQYAIERSASLFPGTWTAITTNTGTGTDMEFDDTYSGQVKFYRVRILP